MIMVKEIANSFASFRRAFGIAITLVLFSMHGVTRAAVTELPPIAEPKVKPGSAGSPKAADAVETKRQRTTSSGGKEAMAGVSPEDRSMIAKACRMEQYAGPAAFHECERVQAAAARNAVKASFDGVSSEDRAMIAKACRMEQYAGPAAFHACERKQVASAKASSAPSFERVSPADRSLIAKACRMEQYSGPAAYRACERAQVSQLRAMQNTMSGRKP